MIKVLLVIPTLDQSGAEKQFGLLAARLPRGEFDVRVVALQRGGKYAEVLAKQGVPVDVLAKRGRIDMRNLRQLRQIIRGWQPQVVLSGLFAANASVRLAMLGMRSRPATIISERCVDSWKSGWQLWLDRRLSSRMDQLVANSRGVADFYAGVGIPADKIAVIPNGIEEPPLPQLSRAELLRELQLPDDAKLVAFVGRLAKQKRIPELLWAAQLLRQFEPRARFLVIGDGPLRGELELYAREVEVSGHVRFLGHRDDAASLLHLVDVFWLASEFEGMSNSLMEALACGKPVVVSDIPPNRELVRHGVDGWIVNLGDSPGFAQFTAQLLANPEEAARLGATGQARMREDFSIEKMVESYAELLRSAARGEKWSD